MRTRMGRMVGKGDEGAETPNGMHLLHEWYFLLYVDIGQIIITAYNRKLEEKKDKVKQKKQTLKRNENNFFFIFDKIFFFP